MVKKMVLLLLPLAAARPGWEEEACLPRNRGGQNYECTAAGRIRCKGGWIGDLCQVPVCGPECDPQHGFCTRPGECRCNLGYSGPGCRECKKLPGCLHGSCTKSFECKCEEGWSGVFCSVATCPEECQAGGRGHCPEPGVCACTAGHRGEGCQECAPPAGCRHGSCTSPGECLCAPGWVGPLCDRPLCDDCGHGDCWEPGVCRCRLGWAGDRCDECVAYPGCANGECLREPYQCVCRPGWRGHLCDKPEVAEYGPGEREGRCLPLGSFLCMEGGADRCRYSGSGQLVGSPRCQCAPGREGTYCERQAGVEPRQAGHHITAATGDVKEAPTGRKKPEMSKKVASETETEKSIKILKSMNLSKTSTKTLYPEVVAQARPPVGLQAVHGDLAAGVLDAGLGLGEESLA